MFINLTNAQLELLLEHIDFLEDLATGKRTPKTEAQRHFMKVVRGEAEATTEFEVAYQTWKRSGASLSSLVRERAKNIKKRLGATAYPAESFQGQSARKVMKLSELARRDRSPQTVVPPAKDAKVEQSMPPKIVKRDKIPGAGLTQKPKNYTRKIAEPWGSREAFKQDRSSWKNGGS